MPAPTIAAAPRGIPHAPLTVDLTGRVAVVTGATSGIGREVAHGLAGLGARVVLVGRDAGKVGRACAELVERGVDPGLLTGGIADLSRPAQVARLAEDLVERHARIDVLVNDAVCYPSAVTLTPEGFEESWATNVLAYEMLTTRLQDRLRESRGRVVYVSSSFAGGLRTDDLLWQRRWFSGGRAYAQSKQAERMLAHAWHRRLHRDGVTVNAAHPHGTATNIARRQSGVWGLITQTTFGLLHPAAHGADTPLWLAADPALEGHSGTYFHKRRRHADSYASRVDDSERLWNLVQEQLKPYL